jgi:hypothetical protein
VVAFSGIGNILGAIQIRGIVSIEEKNLYICNALVKKL